MASTDQRQDRAIQALSNKFDRFIQVLQGAVGRKEEEDKAQKIYQNKVLRSLQHMDPEFEYLQYYEVDPDLSGQRERAKMDIMQQKQFIKKQVTKLLAELGAADAQIDEFIKEMNKDNIDSTLFVILRDIISPVVRQKRKTEILQASAKSGRRRTVLLHSGQPFLKF